MKIALLVIAVCITGLLLMPSVQRFLSTLYLIARVTPYEQTVAGAPTILVLGDSTGYGMGASQSTESIAGRLGADYPQFSIQNNSVNGRTIGELVPVAQQLDGQYALILLQIGGNDILQKRDPELVAAELRTIIESLEAHTEHIVMMSSGNVGGAAAFTGDAAAAYEELTRTFRSQFMQVASTTDMTYVDLFLEPADDLFISDPKTYLAADELHPSSAGYAFWYQSLRPVLKTTGL